MENGLNSLRTEKVFNFLIRKSKSMLYTKDTPKTDLEIPIRNNKKVILISDKVQLGQNH